MGFRNFLKRMLIGDQKIEITTEKIEQFLERRDVSELAIKKFALHCAVSRIADMVASAEIRTYQNEKEIFDTEWYCWNIEPNKNQSAGEFFRELATTLLEKNECLVIEHGGQRIIAENFCKEEFAFRETVFTSVTRKGETIQKTFLMHEVFYFKYSNKETSKIINEICNGYQELLKGAVEIFEKGNGEKGTIKIDTTAIGQEIGGMTYEEIIEDLMNDKFKNYFNSKNAVLPLFEGYEYTRHPSKENKKSTSEVKDITDLTGEIIDRVAQSFRIPPALLKGTTADLESASENFLLFCINPFLRGLEKEMNRKLNGEKVKEGTRIQIVPDTRPADLFKVAEKVDKLIASGMYCVDELRRKIGDTELKTEQSQKHVITKNYTDMENLKGGEETNDKSTNV